MSFINQPDDIIIEQLRLVPFEDLLNACQSSPEISRICQGKQLWQWRLIDDFNVTRVPQDPKEYYFTLMRERQKILNLILSNITLQFFTDANGLFDDPILQTYQEFTDFQRRVVERLTEKEIDGINFIIARPPHQRILHYESGGASEINALFFYPSFSSQDLSGSSYIINTVSIY